MLQSRHAYRQRHIRLLKPRLQYTSSYFMDTTSAAAASTELDGADRITLEWAEMCEPGTEIVWIGDLDGIVAVYRVARLVPDLLAGQAEAETTML